MDDINRGTLVVPMYRGYNILCTSSMTLENRSIDFGAESVERIHFRQATLIFRVGLSNSTTFFVSNKSTNIIN